jgi:hypothetical protein
VNLSADTKGCDPPPGVPEHVVVDDNPVRLLERLSGENKGGDVHLRFEATHEWPNGVIELTYAVVPET